jgi:inner membrane protein involved in colicin E2 resistance
MAMFWMNADLSTPVLVYAALILLIPIILVSDIIYTRHQHARK